MNKDVDQENTAHIVAASVSGLKEVASPEVELRSMIKNFLKLVIR